MTDAPKSPPQHGIVDTLWAWVNSPSLNRSAQEAFKRAADEIDRLRAALAKMTEARDQANDDKAAYSLSGVRLQKRAEAAEARVKVLTEWMDDFGDFPFCHLHEVQRAQELARRVLAADKETAP